MTRSAKGHIYVVSNTITNKIVNIDDRNDTYAIVWDALNDEYKHSAVLTASAITYEQLDSIGDVGIGAGQLLPGDYRFNLDEVNLITDGTTSHLSNLASHYAHTVSSYVAYDPMITDNGDGTISISAAEAFMKTSNFGHAHLEAVTVPATVTPIPIPLDQNYIVYVDYNGGSPMYAAMASVPGYFYNNWDTVPFATVINIGSKIIVNDFSDAPINGTYKNILGQLNYQPIRYLGGLGTAEVGTRQLSVASGAILQGNEFHAVSAINTSTVDTFTRMYVTSGTWTRTTGQTTINNLQYNNPATGLVTVTALPERWINKWLYYIVDSPNFWIVVEGQNLYTSLAEAAAGGVPSVLPPEVSQYYAGSLLVAKIIVSTNATNIVSIQNPFTQTFQTTAATNHDNLSNINLAAFGITYGHINASTQTIAGAKTFSSPVTSANFISNVAVGTAPYATTSTTLNTNLNADLLDSQHGSYYLDRANHTGTLVASNITDFDTEVSNNIDVAANTAARHITVTVADSSTIDFTLTGQQITASVIQSAISHLSIANVGTNTHNQIDTHIATFNGIINHQENLDVDSAAPEVIATVSTSSYDAAVFEYVVKNGVNLRAGIVMAATDGTSVTYTEMSTTDLGDTSGVTLSVDISGTDMRLIGTVTSDNWEIKTIVKTL